MITWLERLTRGDRPRHGGKAAALGELAAAGLPVPPGFVVGPEAYEAFLAAQPGFAAYLDGAEALDPHEVEREAQAGFGSLPLPGFLEQGVRQAYHELSRRVGVPDPAVAVRSSARGEDGEAASFAGQQVTYLNARGEELVLACVRGCWAGLWSARASAYRTGLAAGPERGMAVLVQALVLPEVAGVAFTVNPVTGDRDELVIDASWGLGEAVVSGRTSPDHVRVAKATGLATHYEVGAKAIEVVPEATGVVERPSPPERAGQRALTPEMVAALAMLARDVEARLGGPQDLEWALAGGHVYLLQARPITALPPPPPPGGWVGPEPGVLWERRNFAEHLPGPVSPLARGLVLPAVGEAVARLAESVGYGVRRPVLVTIHGYAYARGTLANTWRMGVCVPWVYGRLFARAPRHWQWAGAYADRLAPLLAAPPVGAPARVAWCEAFVAAFALAWGDLHRLSGGWRWSELALERALAGAPTAALLQGFDAPALAFERRVAALARSLAPAGLAALEGSAPLPEAMRQALAGLHAEALGFVASFDPLDPLPYEELGAVARLVAARRRDPGEDPGARQAALAARRAEAERAALAATRWPKPVVRALIRWAQGFAAEREPALAALGHGWAALRRELLALGAEFAAAGKIAGPEDVFFLEWPEVKAMAAGGAGPGDVADRQAAHAAARLLAPPMAIGAPAARIYARAGAIAGAPASPGRVSGVARVVTGPHEFDTFQPGEILVAPATSPAWTPLFQRAAAVVTDVGGPLSHGSIVAREYGIPAVLGTETATHRLRSGERITVDGDLGLVWKS